MFDPSRDEARRFFVEAWRKSRAGEVLTPLEAIASDWIDAHPEWHADFAPDAVAREYGVEGARANPFLHVAMHLSLTEQASIDQPRGIRAAIEQLAARVGSMHDAHHAAMECLGEMLWRSQRDGTPPDSDTYVECVRRRATRDGRVSGA